MKFRLEPRLTPNGFAINRWYRGKGYWKDVKWKVIDHIRINGRRNIWRNSNLLPTSNYVFCNCSRHVDFGEGVVVKVGIEDIDKNS